MGGVNEETAWRTAPGDAIALVRALEVIGRWVDADYTDAPRRLLEWVRVTKVCSEAGEVQDALEIAQGGNPRKRGTKTYADVEKELLDAAGAALGALEFLRGYDGTSLRALAAHMDGVAKRAMEHGATADFDRVIPVLDSTCQTCQLPVSRSNAKSNFWVHVGAKIPEPSHGAVPTWDRA